MDTTPYSKAIAATVAAIGALAGLLIGLVSGNTEVGAAVATIFVAVSPIVVYWAPANTRRPSLQDVDPSGNDLDRPR